MNENWCYNCGNIIKIENSNYCSEKCKLEIHYQMEQIKLEEEQQIAKDKSVLDEVKTILSSDDYDEFLGILEYSENYNFTITDIPIATHNEGKIFNKKYKQYCNQHSYGDSGDSWYGYISIELPTKKYVNFQYRC